MEARTKSIILSLIFIGVTWGCFIAGVYLLGTIDKIPYDKPWMYAVHAFCSMFYILLGVLSWVLSWFSSKFRRLENRVKRLEEGGKVEE